jgi:hypothetical protein
MENTMNKVYARNCHYNAVQMLNEIYDLVKSNGGYLVSDWQKELTYTEIHNRQVKDMPSVVTPFWGASTCYMKFYLDGFVYYLEFPAENIRCGKINVNDHLIATSKCYCETIAGSNDIVSKLYDLREVNSTLIKEVAQEVFTTILNMESNPYTVTEARQIPNTYDGGYHTENVPVKYKCMYYKIDVEN